MPRRLVGFLCLVIVGCGGPDTAPAPAESAEPVSITVLAAVSLTEAFQAADGQVPQVRPRFAFAGSQQLVTQLTQGAAADVVATADDVSMQRLVDARLVGPPATIARTDLVIAVPPGNPKAITGLADLTRPGLAVVLADPTVPAGRYAAQILEAGGIRVRPRSLELDARATLARVTSGAADAAIVYATDVRSSGAKAVAVPLPEAAGPTSKVSYRIAVVSATGRRQAAEAFVTAAVSGPVRDALLAAGFTT